MIGVIVWSSVAREKAVIWCEDQAALAYLQGRDCLTDPDCWPEPGDLVELESEEIGTLRHARQVSMLSERSRPDLPQLLAQQSLPQADTHLKLVASRPGPHEAAPAREQDERRRGLRICAAG